MKLPADVKQKWVAALRSGEYKQAARTLYSPIVDGYCCLGVLEMVCTGEVERTESSIPYGKPSTAFWEHIGAEDYQSDQMFQDMRVLIEMNDGNMMPRKSFKEIADWIEENIETK